MIIFRIGPSQLGKSFEEAKENQICWGWKAKGVIQEQETYTGLCALPLNQSLHAQIRHQSIKDDQKRLFMSRVLMKLYEMWKDRLSRCLDVFHCLPFHFPYIFTSDFQKSAHADSRQWAPYEKMLRTHRTLCIGNMFIVSWNQTLHPCWSMRKIMNRAFLHSFSFLLDLVYFLQVTQADYATHDCEIACSVFLRSIWEFPASRTTQNKMLSLKNHEDAWN